MKIIKKLVLSLAISIASAIGIVACNNRIELIDEFDKYENELRWKKYYESAILPVEKKLIGIISRTLGINKEQLKPETSLSRDLGITEQNMSKLTGALEKSFAIEISDKEMHNYSTISEYTNFLLEKLHPPCDYNWSKYRGIVYPDDVYFTKEGYWLRKEDNLIVIGITHDLQDFLGDLVYVSLPEPNEIIKKGQTLAIIESVKAATDLISPVTGLIVHVNHQLRECREQIDEDPYGNGWIVKVIMPDNLELKDFLTSKEFEQLVFEKKIEESRDKNN